MNGGGQGVVATYGNALHRLRTLLCDVDLRPCDGEIEELVELEESILTNNRN